MTARIPKILVFCPDAAQAQRYQELVLACHPGAPVATAKTEDEAEPHIEETEILLGWQVPAGLLQRATRLQWMQKTGAGVEDLVLGDVLPRHVVLTRCDGAILAPRMIEYVFGAIYAHTQKFHLAWEQQQRREWRYYMVDRAEGAMLGVAGLGDIGGAIARRAVASGFKVIGWRRSPRAEPGLERVFAGREHLKEFMALCDYLVLVLPLTPSTSGMFNADVLSSARKGCFLINIGRGAVIVENDLVHALKCGPLGGAMLDVFAEEPLPFNHLLWTLPNLHLTPHVSGPIVPEDVAPFFLENLDLYLHGRPLLREVDRALGY